MRSRSTLAALCVSLNEAGADYVLIGSQAMLLHGGGRSSRDVEILVSSAEENAERVVRALQVCHVLRVPPLHPSVLATHAVTVLGGSWRVVVFTAAWSLTYAEARAGALTILVDDVPVPTASVRHLIASKQTGRLQDAADLELLQEIARRTTRPTPPDVPAFIVDHARLAEVCRRHHIRRLSLFGSVLTPRFSRGSDVDVLVEFESGRTPGLAVADVENELSTVFSGHRVDLVTPASLHRAIRDRVLRSAVTQYGG